jgi:glycogen synthase
VIHVQSYHTLVAPLAMATALRAGLPYVVTFHGGGHSSHWRNRARVAQRRALRPLLTRADRLVAVAEFERDDYGRELRVPASRFAVIPNGTDVAAFSQVPPSRGPNVVDPVIATVGRLEEYKGHHRVIGALPVLLESVPGARLVIVGTGPYEQALRGMARSLGVEDRVTFTSTPPGDSAALATLLSKVDLVVLLSEFETHPLAALEAAAAKRRLLVSDRGGMREIAAHGLARSIPFGSGSAEIADAMKQALAAPAPADVFQIPTWDDCAEQLVALYRSVSRR